MNKEKPTSTRDQPPSEPFLFIPGQPAWRRKALQKAAVGLTISWIIIRANLQIFRLMDSTPELIPPPSTPADMHDPTVMAEFAATLMSMGGWGTAQPTVTPFAPVSTNDILLTDMAGTLDALEIRSTPQVTENGNEQMGLVDLEP